jgi:hypothetical protein
MCPLLEQHRLWERMESGEFRLRTTSRPKKNPKPDYKGRLLVANEENFILDDRFPPKHERHIVARLHCHRLADGSMGASEKMDPKELLIGDIQYRQLEFENPACALCEGGDFIPRKKRFYGSTYRPIRLQIMWIRLIRFFSSARVED